VAVEEVEDEPMIITKKEFEKLEKKLQESEKT